MSREEYRNHVHKILDLVMDIQEKKSKKTRVGMEVYAGTKDVGVFVVEGKGKASAMYCTNYHREDEMDTTEEIIDALTKLKAELETSHE